MLVDLGRLRHLVAMEAPVVKHPPAGCWPVVKATMRLSFSTRLRCPPRPSGQPRRAGPGDLFRYGGPAGIQVVEAACQRVRLRGLAAVSRSS